LISYSASEKFFGDKNENFRGAFYSPHRWQHLSPRQVTFDAKMKFFVVLSTLLTAGNSFRLFDSSLIIL
jgi:hypothetical protein